MGAPRCLDARIGVRSELRGAGGFDRWSLGLAGGPLTLWGMTAMGGLRCDRILLGTALVLVLAVPIRASADPELPTAFEDAVPMPPRATLPPPTAADLTGEPGPETPATTVAAPPPAETAVATETVAPDPLAALDPADRPIAEKMRDLLAAKLDKIFANKKERAAAEAFYQRRNLAPLWIEKGIATERAKAAVARLKAADADGLDPHDYRIPDLRATSPDALAEAELRLTATV